MNTMRRMLWGSVILWGLAGAGAGQERIALTSPETYASNTQYRIGRVILDPEAGQLVILLLGTNSEPRSCVYNATTTPTGAFLLTALNKADLSSAYAGTATTGSLKQRICHRLVVLGESAQVCGVAIAGSCTGAVP